MIKQRASNVKCGNTGDVRFSQMGWLLTLMMSTKLLTHSSKN